MLSLIIALLVSIIAIYFIWRRGSMSGLKKDPVHLPRNDRSGDIIPFNRRHKLPPMPKTMEEAERQSWNFFYDLADKIKKLFSKEDSKQMYGLGKALLTAGLEYVHVIVFDVEAARQAARIKRSVSPGEKDKQKDIKR